MRSKLAGADLRYLIDSVFLHPKLPQQEEQHRRRKDTFLIEFITSVAAGFGTIMTQPNEETSGEGWRIIKRMLINMLSLHSSDSLSGEELKASLLNMNKKGTQLHPCMVIQLLIIFRHRCHSIVYYSSERRSHLSQRLPRSCHF